MYEIKCNTETLILLHQKAIYWQRERMLILADMHLGKTGYFRSRGIQIPSTVLVNDLTRLAQLIEAYQPAKILVVGDMFHHDHNTDIDYFDQWRKIRAGIEWILVPGNHDKLLPINYNELGITLTGNEYLSSPFLFVHEANGSTVNSFTISGHLHPGYILEGRARQNLRLPCFIISENHMILPAFSSFTGLYTGYSINKSDRYYVIGKDKIFAL